MRSFKAFHQASSGRAPRNSIKRNAALMLVRARRGSANRALPARLASRSRRILGRRHDPQEKLHIRVNRATWRLEGGASGLLAKPERSHGNSANANRPRVIASILRFGHLT